MSGPVLVDTCQGGIFEFGDATEFVIGRSQLANLNIVETCISRNQCSIKKVPEGEWLIVDKSSFKSTFVNTVKIPSSGLYLKSGDVITFSNLETWKLFFYESEDDIPPSTKRRRLDRGVTLSSQESQRSASRSPARSERSRCSVLSSIVETPNVRQHSRDAGGRTELVEAKKKLEESLVALQEKVKQLEEEKNRADEVVVTSHLDHMGFLSAYEDMKTELGRLVDERNGLQEELVETVKKLEASAVPGAGSSTDTEMATELILKTMEAEELRNEHESLKAECDELKSINAVLSCKTDKVYTDAVAIVEQEFMCCVCSDLLFEPVTLNCRHTFCKTCVNEWKKKKKECPSCRAKIKTEVSAILIDSFLDRVAPVLGEEFVKKREEAKRDHALRRNPPPPPPPPTRPTTVPANLAGPSYGARGRRGGRGARRGRGGYQYVPPPPPPHHNPVPAPVPHVGEVIDLTSGMSPQAANRRRNPGQGVAQPDPAQPEESQEEFEVTDSVDSSDNDNDDDEDDMYFEDYPVPDSYFDTDDSDFEDLAYLAFL